MRLRARLVKLETRSAADGSDFSNLSDAELVAELRDCITALGLDWAALRDDPSGTLRASFDGYENEDDLIEELAGVFDDLSADWFRHT